jgi:hypothetical protein
MECLAKVAYHYQTWRSKTMLVPLLLVAVYSRLCPPVIGTIATKNAAGDAESVMRRGPIPSDHFHTPLPSTADPHVSVLLPFPGLINSINTNLLHPGVGTRLFDTVYLLGVSAGP